MKRDVKISVSTEPVKDCQEVIEYAKKLQGLADFIHCDIMDGEFVHNKTFDESVVYNINQNSLTMLDVHLMVNEPLERIDGFIDAGANILTLHYEAFKNKEDLHKALKKIRKKGVLAGLSFKPNTPVDDIKLYLYSVDVILIMGVEPGASGQKLISNTIQKVKNLNEYRMANKMNFKIEVDGGINPENAPLLADAGADILVSGNFVYKSHDYMEAINSLRG